MKRLVSRLDAGLVKKEKLNVMMKNWSDVRLRSNQVTHKSYQCKGGNCNVDSKCLSRCTVPYGTLRCKFTVPTVLH